MTENLAGILEESRRAVVYMQLPIVGFLAIASFQARRAQGKAAFALGGYGWILNVVYIAFSSGTRFMQWPARLGLADSLQTEVLASFFDVGTDGFFVLAYLAANGTRLFPPKWLRFDVIALVGVMIASWSGSVLGLSVANRFFGALVSSIYKVFFAWWLDGLTSRGLWRRLERDIRNDYTWLFQEYKATALPFEPYRQVRNRSVK